MRRLVLPLVWLVATVPVVAAPVPGTPVAPLSPTARVHLRAAVRKYAEQLTLIVQEASLTYVRAVSQAELAEAALRNLYAAADVPFPHGLRQRLERAEKAGMMLDAILQAREDLGDREPLRHPADFLASLRGMVRILDPHCAVVSRDGSAGREGTHLFGLGLQLAPLAARKSLIVKSVVPGSPAQKAGLKPGDQITHFDDREVSDPKLLQTLVVLDRTIHRMDGPPFPGLSPDVPYPAPTEKVHLTVVSGSPGRPRRVTLQPEEFREETVFGVIRHKSNAWDYWLDPRRRIAHVRLGRIGQNTHWELEQVLSGLDAGPGMQGLILDLRWCPGGYLSPAVAVAGLFLDEGIIATIKSRTQDDQVYRAGGETKFTQFPMVVLVGGETTGAGELIAAALKDHGRAAILGMRTRGKGSVQNAITLEVPGSELRLTTGTFLRPSGKNLHRFPDSTPDDDWGVLPDPDLELRLSPQLQRQLHDWWEQQTLRPGMSAQSLPLDDPTADPVRQAAVRALEKLQGARRQPPQPASRD
jgi:carboxyl-terminal processing protease